MIKRATSALILTLALSACATTAQVDQRIDQWETTQREEIEALKRAVEASYERERAVADRLRQTEEASGELRQELDAIKDQNKTLRTELDSLPASPVMPETRSRSNKSNVFKIYQGALEQYRSRKYDRALVEFDRLLQAAPFSEWSDNAQYWKGECYYGIGKYRQALTEFTKVFAFRKTEKADDAQLKIARCHLALGERNRALAAFRKLLDEYPESEYLPAARKEMKYLGS
ncbi:MAG: tetratricopeptide repeat protein [Candidatus Latescibacterota bacterium]|nr:tetratricopeptide repeat protein [Candidatus Latescibacterota bacterium]